MKTGLVLILGLLPALAIAQSNSVQKISAADAKDYIGKSLTVTGRVAEVHIAEKLVRINLDKRFPNQPFTAVIFAARTNLFSDLSGLKDQNVEVTGSIAEFRDRPEIIISRTNQLVVIPQETK